MDYEKKYKAALNWMKDVYPTLEGAAKEDANHYFPELIDSEDERIRKYIIEALKGEGYYDCDLTNECIAWVEKQSKKNEWSNEDEMIVLSIKQIVTCASFLNIVPETLDRIDKWLESLKQRIKK